jgi:DNA invertase Pin-like site-specific DNA recombinase
MGPGDRVAAMLRLHREGASMAAIGRQYGISRQRVAVLLANTDRRRRPHGGQRKLSAEQVNAAVRLHDAGAPWKAIAAHLGVHHETLRRAVRPLGQVRRWRRRAH